jgi:hypothetical protein
MLVPVAGIIRSFLPGAKKSLVAGRDVVVLDDIREEVPAIR